MTSILTERVDQGDEESGQPTDGEDGCVLASSVDSKFCDNHRMLSLLFDNMLEGYAYCRMLYDDNGHPDDFVYLGVNPAFATLTGLSDVLGKRVTEIIPGIKESNPEIFVTYGRVAREGSHEHFEIEIPQLSLELRVTVFQPERDHFVAVFDDISARKRAERELEELNRYLELRIEERTKDLAECLQISDRD